MWTALGLWFLAWVIVVIIGAIDLGLKEKRTGVRPKATLYGFLENMLYLILVVGILYVAITHFFAAV